LTYDLTVGAKVFSFVTCLDLLIL